MDDSREVDSIRPDVVGHELAVHQLAARLIPHLPVGFDQTAVIKLVTATLALGDNYAFREFIAALAELSKK